MKYKTIDLFSEKVIPQTPVPDYGDIASPENQSVFKFAEKFKTVLSSIHQIGIANNYTQLGEREIALYL